MVAAAVVAVLAQLLGQPLGRCPDSFHLRWGALTRDLPPQRVEAIARRESQCNLNPHLRGHLCWRTSPHRDCEWGRFQIRPATARKRCRDLDIRTYRGNVDCFFRIFGEDVQRYGVTDATIRYNGSLEYLRDVLRIEQRLGVPRAVDAGDTPECVPDTSSGTADRSGPPPALRERMTP